MSAIWGENGNEGGEEFTDQIRTALGKDSNGNGGNRPVDAYRTSRLPLNEGERAVYKIFDKLRSKTYNMTEKRMIAEAVLRGEYGIKHELHAKLLLGPNDLQEIIESPMDIVPPLLEVINDRDQIVREKIAAVLEKRGDERAIDAMCAKLDSDNYSERHVYGVALGKMARSNISDVEALQKIRVEIEKRRETTEEFSNAWRCVRGKLRDLGAVVPKPEKKRISPPKKRSGNVTAPLELKNIIIKPVGGRGDKTIPFLFKK